MNQTHWAEFTLLINLGTASSKSERKNEATSAMQQSYKTSSRKAPLIPPRLLSLSVCVTSLLCRSCTASGFSALPFCCVSHVRCIPQLLHDVWQTTGDTASPPTACRWFVLKTFLLRWNQKKGSEVEWRNTIIDQLFICLHFISLWSVAFIYIELCKTKQWSAGGLRSLSSVAVSHDCTAGYRHLHLVCILPWQLVTDIFTTWASLNVLQSQD